jgi:hypothetical protein
LITLCWDWENVLFSVIVASTNCASNVGWLLKQNTIGLKQIFKIHSKFFPISLPARMSVKVSGHGDIEKLSKAQERSQLFQAKCDGRVGADLKGIKF